MHMSDHDRPFLGINKDIFRTPLWLKSTPGQKVVLITLLEMVAYQDNQWEWQGKQYTVRRGQVITSLDTICRRAGKGITSQITRNAIAKFEKLGFLTNESTKTGRLISIINPDHYLARKNKPNKEPNKQRTKTEQSSNTYQEVKEVSLDVSKKTSSCSKPQNDQTPPDSQEEKIAIDSLILSEDMKDLTRKEQGMFLTDGKLQRAFEQFQEYYSGSQLRPLKEWIRLWQDWCGNRKHWPEPKKAKQDKAEEDFLKKLPPLLVPHGMSKDEAAEREKRHREQALEQFRQHRERKAMGLVG